MKSKIIKLKNNTCLQFKCADCGMLLESAGVCDKCGSHNIRRTRTRSSPFTPIDKHLEKVIENS